MKLFQTFPSRYSVGRIHLLDKQGNPACTVKSANGQVVEGKKDEVTCRICNPQASLSLPPIEEPEYY